MNPQTLTVASSTAQKTLGAFADWNSVPFIGIPLIIFGWCFQKSISYYKDNDQFHQTLEDGIYSSSFKKIIVPLFSFINSTLTAEVIRTNDLPTPPTSAEDILRASDSSKERLLTELDFSMLEPAIQFQDSVQNIIKSKRNQIYLKKRIIRSQVALIVTTVISFLDLLLGFAVVLCQAMLGADHIATQTVFLFWLVFLFLSLIGGMVFWCYRIALEQMRYE